MAIAQCTLQLGSAPPTSVTCCLLLDPSSINQLFRQTSDSPTSFQSQALRFYLHLSAYIAHDAAAMTQDAPSDLRYVRYDSARENEYVAAMRQLISKDLSEPYSIYVYRYFLYQWGDLCFLAMDDKDEMVGVVVSKLEPHRGGPLRGYIAMLAVREEYRGRGIATKLVRMAIDAMIERNADEVCVSPAGKNLLPALALLTTPCVACRSSSKPKSPIPLQ